jgi:hypothetical protein
MEVFLDADSQYPIVLPELIELVEWIGPLSSGHALEVRMHTVCARYDLVHHRASTV